MSTESNMPWVGNLHHSRETYDDWGHIRDETDCLVITVTPPYSEIGNFTKHRDDGTDPSQKRVDAILSALNPTSSFELPTAPGFYWWREESDHEWRMIHIVDFGGVLSAFDVQLYDVNGKTLEWWQKRYLIGEWIPVKKP